MTSSNSRNWLDRLRSFWIDHLWLDEVIALAALGLHAAIVLAYPTADVLGNALPADRRAVYASTAVVVSLLGSFSSVAISQLSSAKGDRAEALRSQGATDLAKNWRSIFRAGMVSALIAIAALALDPSEHTGSALPVLVRWLFEWALLVAVVKFLRLSALFFEVITVAGISESDGDEPAKGPAPTLNPRFSAATDAVDSSKPEND